MSAVFGFLVENVDIPRLSLARLEVHLILDSQPGKPRRAVVDVPGIAATAGLFFPQPEPYVSTL